jgi:hypothetical protein
MDASTSTRRKFPGYTTAQLELAVHLDIEGRVILPAKTLAAIKAEISARKAGLSQPFYTPQI